MIASAHSSQPETVGRLLESYRAYLMLMARVSMRDELRGKLAWSDVVQETMLKAHQAFGQFQGETEGELAAWLRQILARTVADLARRYRRGRRDVYHEQSLADALDDSESRCRKLITADQTSPSAQLQRREASVLLADALELLPADYREVISLRTLEERGWNEVAAELGRSPDAARMLWVRAIKQLRVVLEGKL
jgi:RNA polymerase sigma-70 factor (ECF subfamily)